MLFCRGTACFVARHLAPERWRQAEASEPRVYCLGKCYLGPASSDAEAMPRIEVRSREAVVLANLARGGAPSLERYLQQGGYQALRRARDLAPQEIIVEIEASGLRGRGGAGFPTGRKWRSVFQQPVQEKYLVANADEGDPGAYIDRLLMEQDPHRLLEAMAIAARAVGAHTGYIYLRSEYPHALAAMEQALTEARAAGYLGNDAPAPGGPFDIQIVNGQGSYVCGEETALLNSIAGQRPEVMPRPPYPTEQGLFGRPTAVNNVETLAAVPWIIAHGGQAYRSLGFSQSWGTKVVSLNSLFLRPGLYEVEFGVSVRSIVEELGGGLLTGQLKGVIIGGPLAGVIPPELLDTPFGFEELQAIGAAVGHGGVVAFDEHTSIPELVAHVFDFAAYESCGKCTPCRLGTRWAQRLFSGVQDGWRATGADRQQWEEVVAALADTSLCGLGTGAADFARSILRHYRLELDACFA